MTEIFIYDMVAIGRAGAVLSETFLAQMQVLSKTPELNVPATVLRHLAQRGVLPPTIVYATYLQDTCPLGAAALMVDDFLRKPPTDVV